ncbi:hypothetical protein [Legionella fallonii]|uniref:Ankyrin repeat protein n=1 Tax=Legionella fallonii LLAP-10 TaxID=1212491 RepID=A0A098G7W9_9GAMM|nr:hypothetical protein [Legionella fallonii]CEG58548.1 protein of unknown function [Legionella fallonii LLAP-10]
MPYSFSELHNEFSPDQQNLSPEAMAIAVDQLKQQAQLKGRSFNCLIIDRENPAHDELTDLLLLLNKNKDKVIHERIQVVYRCKKHWSTMDIEIKNGQLSFFLLDAANSLPAVIDTVTSIYTHCPNASLKYSGSNTQMDKYSCAYFSLNDAFNLAKISNLHDILPDCVQMGAIGQFTSYKHFIETIIDRDTNILGNLTKTAVLNAVEHIQYIPIRNWPKEFGSLIKNIQSLTMFASLSKEKKYLRYNTKPTADYIEQHTVTCQDSPYAPPAQRNNAIENKKNKIKISALQHLKEHEEDFGTIINARQRGSSALFSEEKHEKNIASTDKNIPLKRSIAPKEEKETIIVDSKKLDSDLFIETQPIDGKYLHKKSNFILSKQVEIDLLFTSIQNMKRHGKTLSLSGSVHGEMVTVLAKKLKKLTQDFITKNENKERHEIDFSDFKNNFIKQLHSKDPEMAVHRQWWKVVTANILLALTGVGALFIVVRSLAQGKPSFFFDKTQREKNIIDVDSNIQNLCSIIPEPQEAAVKISAF